MKDYGNCSYCDFTYSPCPIHEPDEHAALRLRLDKALAERDEAHEELRRRWDELPEWAQHALRKARVIGLVVPT